MAIAYKWRIDNNRTAYITDENGGEPFVYSNLSGYTRQKASQIGSESCIGMPLDKTIEIAVNSLDESAYKRNFKALRNLLRLYYQYDLAESDTYNTEAYYWPENEYNKTGLDVSPNLEIVDAEDAPSLTAELYGTDSTKKIKLDIKIPAGYDGFSCYLSPDSLSFVREDIINGHDAISASTEIMLFRGTKKLDPYSIRVEQSYTDDNITISGNTIIIKPHIEVIPSNNTRAVYSLRTVAGSVEGGNNGEGVNTTTRPPQTTTTSTPDPIDTTTSTREREKIELSDRKIWVYVTYRWREYGSNEFRYFNTKLLLRYNILTYDLQEASNRGSLNSENFDTKDRFEKWVRDLSGQTVTYFGVCASAFTIAAIDAVSSASTAIRVLAERIRLEQEQNISGLSHSLYIKADELKEEFTNKEKEQRHLIETTAYGQKELLENKLSGLSSEFETFAGIEVKTFQDKVNSGTTQVREGLDGIVQIMSGYCSGLTSQFELLKSGVAGFVTDDFKDYSSQFVFEADKMLLAVSSVTGTYNGLIKTAEEIEQLSKKEGQIASILQTASAICYSAEGDIANLNGEVERKKSSIEQRAGEIKIKSGEIKLEGKTTFNNGFTILDDGTAVIDNGFLHGYSQGIVKDITNERLFVNCNTNIVYSYNNGKDTIEVSGFTVNDFTKLTGGVSGVEEHFGDRIYEIPMCLEMAKYGNSGHTSGQTPLYLDEGHAIYASSGIQYSVYTINKKSPTNLLLDARKLKEDKKDRVQIFLPIDDFYVGSKIKIIVNNIGGEGRKAIFPEITVGYTNNYGVYWGEVISAPNQSKESVWYNGTHGDHLENKVSPFALLDSCSTELIQICPWITKDGIVYNVLSLGTSGNTTSAFTGYVELSAVPSEFPFIGRRDAFLSNGLPIRMPVVSGGSISFGAVSDENNNVDSLVRDYTIPQTKTEEIYLARWIISEINVVEGVYEYKKMKTSVG